MEMDEYGIEMLGIWDENATKYGKEIGILDGNVRIWNRNARNMG